MHIDDEMFAEINFRLSLACLININCHGSVKFCGDLFFLKYSPRKYRNNKSFVKLNRLYSMTPTPIKSKLTMCCHTIWCHDYQTDHHFRLMSLLYCDGCPMKSFTDYFATFTLTFCEQLHNYRLHSSEHTTLILSFGQTGLGKQCRLRAVWSGLKLFAIPSAALGHITLW